MIAVRSTHLRAHPDGRVVIEVEGPDDGPARAATVTLASARRLSTRWLGGTGPRVVTFGSARVVLTPGRRTRATIRLTRSRLALLHRMQTVRVGVRVTVPGRAGGTSRRLDLHAPRRRKP